MTLAMAFGTFSLIHPGHIYYLERAKSLADKLVVVVARDSTVKKVKGKNIIPEEQRRRVVEALKPVDEAILGDPSDKYKLIEKYKPDVLVLGPDHSTDELEGELQRRGLNPKIVKVPKARGKLYKSSQLIKHVCSDER